MYQAMYRSTWEWACTLDPAVRERSYLGFDFGDTVFRGNPVGPGPELHPMFLYAREWSKPAPQFIAKLNGGRIVGTNGYLVPNGAVISPDGRLLWDVSVDYLEPDRHSVFSLKQVPPLLHARESIAVLTAAASYNYYHWMFDVIVRMGLLRLAGIEPDQYLFNRRTTRFQQETLQVLGIPEEKIMECGEETHLQSDRLIVPSLSGCTMHPPKWACETLRGYFLTERGIRPASGYERIYVSRYRTPMRRVDNEPEVAELLEACGFRRVSPESLTVAEQAAIFAAARIVVAPHGAGLTNLVFCSPGTKVIEFFSPDHPNACYWIISQHMNLDYAYFFCRPGERRGDVIVDLAVLRVMLEKAGVASTPETAATLRRIYARRRMRAASILQRMFQVEEAYAFVAEVYRELLHREPEPAGLEYHVNRLRHGTSKIGIVSDILQSEEALRFYGKDG